MEAALSANVAEPRFRSGCSASSLLSVCLVAAGVYSVLSYAVGQRSSEIGLRKALGASTGSVIREVISHGLVLTAIGLAFGFAGAIAVTRLMTTMLFQVTPHDPLVYVGVIVLVGHRHDRRQRRSRLARREHRSVGGASTGVARRARL